MANIKITDLTAYTDPANTDVLPIVDVGADVTKKVSVGEVVGKISGDVDVATDGTSSITAGVIVDADVNASAAIAGTKIDPDFGSQTVETTGVFSAAGGAEATPSIAFTGDPNTGIYSPGADQVAISTNGTGRLFVDSSGNVGIGKNPLYALDVAGSIQITNNQAIRAFNSAGTTSYRVLTPGADDNLYLGGNEAGSNEAIIFRANDSERARITSDGKLGLGTSSPGSILDIKLNDANTTIGGSASVVRVNNDVGQIGSTSGLEFFHGNDTSSNAKRLAAVYGRYDSFNAAGLGGELIFATNTPGDATIDERMRITSAGNVGIGVTSPTSLLHLADAGDITVGTTTGTKIGTATSQKIGFYNATPVVQPTTGVAEAAFVENSGGTAVNVDSTFGGYTIQQVVEALQTLGLLA